jgi:NMT1-like family
MSISEAYKGNEEAGFKTPLDKLRTLAAIYPNYIHFLASADSGIASLADLKGKRVSVGAPKSGTELNSRYRLKAAGMSYADLGKIEYLGYAESVELIKNRQLDATLLSSGLGVAAVRDLATAIKMVVVLIPAEVVTKIGGPLLLPRHHPGQYLQRPDGRCPYRCGTKLPGHPCRRLHRHRLQDDQIDVLEPRCHGRRPRRRQGHQQEHRRQGVAGTASSRRRTVLQGSGSPLNHFSARRPRLLPSAGHSSLASPSAYHERFPPARKGTTRGKLLRT